MTSTPFIVLGLPRSRTTWLSRFLSYGDWICGHDELRHVRSLDDVKAWFSQPNCGTVETDAARWWRLFDRFAPGAQIAIVRRPVDEVVESLLNIPMVSFDRGEIANLMARADKKLDQVAARVPGVIEVHYDDLRSEDACARIFEHCLPYPHDRAWWKHHAGKNIQTDFYALTRYCQAYAPAMARVASIAKQQTLTAMQIKAPREVDGIDFVEVDFVTWLSEAEHLFDAHLILVGEAPGDWRDKNLSLMSKLYDMGCMQIMTARSNGRMFGYLMTLISPSLTSENVTSGTNTTFYADPSMPGLGVKLQRAALSAMKRRGVSEVFMEAGTRGDGPRIGSLFKRLGAAPHGEVYRLDIREAA